MKQLKTLSLLSLTALMLSGCGQAQTNQTTTTTSAPTTTVATTTTTQTSEAAETAKVEILIEGKAHSDKKVTIEAGKNLLEILKENFTVVDKDGFITTIDGIEQDKGDNAGKYWKISVNGEMSQVGAKEIKLKADDVVTFDLTDQW